MQAPENDVPIADQGDARTAGAVFLAGEIASSDRGDAPDLQKLGATHAIVTFSGSSPEGSVASSVQEAVIELNDEFRRFQSSSRIAAPTAEYRLRSFRQ